MGEDRKHHNPETSHSVVTALPGRSRRVEDLILLSPDDNIGVARRDLRCGLQITTPRGVIALQESIPMGHKAALCGIPRGGSVYKYAQVIGRARRPIECGEWVHVHNLELAHGQGTLEYAVESPRPPELPDGLPRMFLGYRRGDGRVGTRNHVVVVPTSNCSSHVCERIAEEVRKEAEDGVDGVFAVPHTDGCAQHTGPDIEQLERTLKGIIAHPNVCAALVVALGCEVNSLTRYCGPGMETIYGKPAAALEIQASGGTVKAVAAGVAKVHSLVEAAASCPRTEEPVGHLTIGLNCGGSDAFSGISANPALGYASDLLVGAGGTVVLAETPEIYGAEQVLTRRAADIKTGKELVRIIERYCEYAARFGATMDSNPAPGNLRGGITNIVEKSLGAVMKGGTTTLNGVIDYAERIAGKGLIVMDTPGYDPVSITGLAAGGCNLIAFTTGRGSGIGFPIVPVLKIASNSRIFRLMADNMDVNAGDILDGNSDIREKGIEIYRQIVRAASGERTRSEILGHREFAPWRIGPVM